MKFLHRHLTVKWRIDGGAFLELTQKFFDEVYMKLARQKPKIIVAVKLLAARKKKSLDGDVADDEDM